MKFTQILWKQHIGRMTKRHWFDHGKQFLGDTGSEFVLAKRGVEIVDAKDFIFKKQHRSPRLDPKELFGGAIIERPPAQDETHPDWKKKPCWQINNNELLVAGTNQAQLLTKTLIVSDRLPIQIENLVQNTTKELDNIVTGIILNSNIFDAHQQKLPIVKDPLRPAFVFPRDFGIGQVRKSRNLLTKMTQLCESICGLEVAERRQLIRDAPIRGTLEKDGELLLYDHTMDMMLLSSDGIKSMGSGIDTSKFTLPDIYPLSPTISLHQNNIYKLTELYPVSNKSPWVNAHTLFIYHDSENVKNFTELPVTQDQLLGRSLMKSFVTAVSCAKEKFGSDVKNLPEPITIQCVQTNSQSFHFSVFQLNTLNIDGIDGKCNLWWSMPQINLFEKADYELAKPIVTSYNPEVFKRMLAFYRNN